MAAFCDIWIFSVGPYFVLWLLKISNKDHLERMRKPSTMKIYQFLWRLEKDAEVN